MAQATTSLEAILDRRARRMRSKRRLLARHPGWSLRRVLRAHSEALPALLTRVGRSLSLPRLQAARKTPSR